MLPSHNFQRREFQCRCGCGANTVDAELLHVLQYIRDFYGRPITITSGHRCESHNKKVGGAGGSQHLTGKAADFVVWGVDPQEVYNFLDAAFSGQYGIGNYRRWTHIDVREERARW